MNQFLNETIAFYEIQRFNQKALILAVIAVALFPIAFFAYGYYLQVVNGVQFGDKPLSNEGLIISLAISLLFAIGMLFLFFASKLETYITSSGLHFRLFPFMKFKTYSFDKIKEYRIRKYRPIMEYGGWGIRIGPAGKAFNISGDIGLQLILETGKKVLIGTQEPEKLLAAMYQFDKKQQ